MSVLDFTDKTLSLEKQSIATFWIIVTGLAALGLAWLYNLSLSTGNAALSTAANSFLILFFISIIVEVFIFMLYKHRFWGRRTEGTSMGISFLFFYIGFVGFTLITRLDMLSVIAPNTLLSQTAVTSALTEFQEIYLNVFTAPIIEENFFRLALPTMLFLATSGILKSFDIEILDNKYINLTVAIILSSVAFVVFHTGQLGNIGFQESAFIFAILLSVVFLADIFLNTFKNITIVPALLVGIHMSNNIQYYGFGRVFSVLMSNNFGIAILIIMGIGALSALRTVMLYFE